MNNDYQRGYTQGQKDFFEVLLKIGFNSRVAEFKSLNKFVKSNGIVFVGDSITQNYCVAEYYQELNVYNRGIGGDTSKGLLKRLDESIFALKPKIVILLIGTNDLPVDNLSSLETINNIKKIIELIKETTPNTHIILESIYPVSTLDHPQISPIDVNCRTNRFIDEINDQLAKIPNVQYLDINSLLKDTDGNIKLEYTTEGLHISPLGYEKITEILSPILTNLMKG